MKLPGKEEKREAKEKISRCSEEGYGEVGAREKDIKNKTLWKNIIRFGNPERRRSQHCFCVCWSMIKFIISRHCGCFCKSL